MTFRTLGLTVLTALALSTAVEAAAPTRQQIQAINDRFGAAVRAGDATALAALYADGATVLPAGAPLMKGRAAIKAYWSQGLGGIGDATLTASDVQSLGPGYARELGTFALKTKGSPSKTLTGKYVVIWKRDDGRWKLWTDIWNSDQP
jgi:uncharacterized protein (TIGR02246 family)